MDAVPGRYLKDSERSARGLGWEHARRGGALGANPFVIASDFELWKHAEFSQGWRDFHAVPKK